MARLTDLDEGVELLDVACGKGILLEYFVRESGVHGTGVDADPELIQAAEAFARQEGLSSEMSFQRAPHSDLPFRDETFDVVVGEVGLAATGDPREAIRELIRVTRPGGKVALVQLVWKAPVEEDRRNILGAHLGATPLMTVELRRTLMDAQVGDLHIEDWTDESTAFRGEIRKPFPDFAELFNLREKLAILRKAWRKWGWRGVRTVFQREAEVHRLLTRDRLLGLNLVIGTKARTFPEAGSGPRLRGEADGGAGASEASPSDLQTSGLPLFGGDSRDDST